VCGAVTILAVVRIRGTVNVRKPVKDTLKLLRLHKPNHMVLVEDKPSISGMLKKAWTQITWGEIDAETLAYVLEMRGRKPGNKPFTLEDVRKLGYESYLDLANAILSGELKLKELYKVIKPVFRLHPPSKGYKGSVKKGVPEGGALGYRGSKINELILRMA